MLSSIQAYLRKAASLGRIVPHALRSGGRIAGMPFARYPDFGQGRFAIEVGMPLVAAVPGEGDIESSLLPGGRAAMAVHAGPYTTLAKSFAALERWMAEQGLASNGAPWEVYANDPADFPDSADWRTEIYWPVK
jgi:AraC family transcriptional regulator